MSPELTMPLRPDVPPDLHPDTMRKLENVLAQPKTIGVSAYAAAREALKLCYESFARLNDAESAVREVAPRRTHSTKYGKRTELVMDYKALAAAAERSLATTTPAIDRRMAELVGYRDQLMKRVTASLDHPRRTTPEGLGAATEIRAHVKNAIPDARRFQFVYDSITGGDIETVAAVLHGKPFLSGLTDAQIGTLRTYAETVFAPQDNAQLQAVMSAIDRVQKAGASLLRRYSAVLDKVPADSAQTAIEHLAGGK